MADISKIKLPDNNTYDFKDSAGRKEAYLEWGGRSLTSSIAPVSMSISAEHSANRIAFLNPAAIDIEYTTNGGSTWTDSGYADTEKTLLCTAIQFIAIGQSKTGYSATTELTTNHWTRVTLTGQNGTTQYVYTDPKKLLINMSTALTVDCLIEYKTGASGAEWKTFGTYAVAGWSGWNDIPLILGTFGGGTNQTGNNWYLRFTFKVTSTRTDNYKGYSGIYGLRLFGTNNWGSASNNYGKGPISATGHLYSYDVNANATFPANVTATRFIGPSDSVRDSGNGTNTTFAYSKSGLSTASWFAAWNGYELRAISPSATANVSLTSLSAATADPTDTTELIRRDTAGANTFYRITFSTVWNYIKGKISSILGLTATNYGGTSAKATADASGNIITTYYAPKSTAVTNVALATNKITKTINGTTTDVVGAASTSGYGITKLNTATNSTSTTEAATPSAVKTAKDRADEAYTEAATAMSGLNGTLIYDHTYSISNGVATFTAHVYQKGEEVTSSYADSCFSWSYKLANAVTGTPSVVSLGTGKTKTITISTLGYGGYVLGTFTPPSA